MRYRRCMEIAAQKSIVLLRSDAITVAADPNLGFRIRTHDLDHRVDPILECGLPPEGSSTCAPVDTEVGDQQRAVTLDHVGRQMACLGSRLLDPASLVWRTGRRSGLRPAAFILAEAAFERFAFVAAQLHVELERLRLDVDLA